MTVHDVALRGREWAAAPWVRAAPGAALLVAVASAVGWALTTDDGIVLGASAIAAFVLAFVAAWNVGVAAGLLVVAILNGVPGIDLEALAETGRFRVSDVLVVVLLVLLGIRALRDARIALADPWFRRASLWSAVFVGWWIWTLVSSVIDDGVPLVQGALFGRDWLYFAIVFPLFIAAFRREREIFGLLATLALAAAVHAVGQLGIVVSGASADEVPPPYSWLVHTTLVNEYEGITRVYAFMSDAVLVALALSTGLALLARTRALRILGAAVFLLAALSVLFQFTRAVYGGLFVGFLVATAVWVSRRQTTAAPVRRTALVAVGIVLAAGTFVYNNGLRPSLSSESRAGAVSERAVSGIEELTSRTGTVGYRYRVSEVMIDRLEGHWLTGLGFWHPSARPVPNLPDNSLRNGDVGVLNGIITMGLIGTALLYVPLVAALIALLRRRVPGDAPRHDWLFYGASAWLLAVLVGSLTLVQLYSVPGLVLTAGVVAGALRVLAIERSRAETQPDPVATT